MNDSQRLSSARPLPSTPARSQRHSLEKQSFIPNKIWLISLLNSMSNSIIALQNVTKRLLSHHTLRFFKYIFSCKVCYLFISLFFFNKHCSFVVTWLHSMDPTSFEDFGFFFSFFILVQEKKTHYEHLRIFNSHL